MPLLLKLRNLQSAADISQSQPTRPFLKEPANLWDDILLEADEDNLPMSRPSSKISALAKISALEKTSASAKKSASALTPSTDSLEPVEFQILCLPSNFNVNGSFEPQELVCRKAQAANHLNCIRNLIADKSFQYSHVIRQTSHAGVRTRSRTNIINLNKEISLHCRMYSHCHAKMVMLNADAETMSLFQPLTRDDIKASTAILSPNTPSSTKLKLSWIWQSTHTRTGMPQSMGTDTASQNECESS